MVLKYIEEIINDPLNKSVIFHLINRSSKRISYYIYVDNKNCQSTKIPINVDEVEYFEQIIKMANEKRAIKKLADKEKAKEVKKNKEAKEKNKLEEKLIDTDIIENEMDEDEEDEIIVNSDLIEDIKKTEEGEGED